MDKDIFAQAVNNHIRTSKYPPTIADIQEQLDYIMPKQSTDEELWNEAYRLICKGSVLTTEEFNQEPEEIKRWFHNIRTIRELAMCPSETVNTVVRGQFLKTIGAIKRQQAVQDSLPQKMKDLINVVTRKELGESYETGY